MRVLTDADPGHPGTPSPSGYLLWVANQQKGSMAAQVVFDTMWLVGLTLMPWAIGRALDEGILASDYDQLLFWVAILLGLSVIQAATQALRYRAAVHNWMQAGFRSVRILGHHITRTGQALTAQKSTGEIAAVGSDAMQLASIYFMTSGLISSLISFAIVAIIVLNASISLGLVVLIGVPALSGLLFVVVNPLKARQAAHREATGQMAALGADTVAGLRVLRGIGGENIFVDLYRAKSRIAQLAGNEVAGPVALVEALLVLMAGILAVGLTWLGAVQAVNGQIQPGALVSLYGYAGFLLLPIRLAADAISTLIRSLIGAKRLLAVLEVRPATDDHEVSGSAPTEPSVLVDTRSGVRIEPGAVVAIVSADPAQSAEVADRLARFDDAELQHRLVTWGGQSITQLPLGDVRSRITLADSDPQFFTGVLRSELDPHAQRTDAQIMDALHAASATDIVESLPDGLNVVMAERGRTFSGGQRQRLGLARALLTEAEVLLLIEPTAAVDVHTEARIGARLPAARKGARPGASTVITTTSPLLLGHVDKVLYIVGGSVVAAGTHRELMESDPNYSATVLRDQE